MQIQNTAGNEPPYHVPTGIGKALIAAGVAKEVIQFTPAPVPNTSWAAREGFRIEVS